MNPEERAEVDRHFRAIHEIMLRHNLVRMSGGWKLEGWAADGRALTHKFRVDGYERTGPRVERDRKAQGIELTAERQDADTQGPATEITDIGCSLSTEPQLAP